MTRLSQGAIQQRVTGREALEHVILERLRTAEVPPGLRGLIGFDLSDGDPWTLHSEKQRLSLSAGLAEEPDTVISCDTETLVGVLDGSLSGIQAFIDDRLRVRGNLALSLRLASLPVNGAPIHRAGDVKARGVSTFYLEAGEGTPVLLLHGLGATNASFLTTFMDLARDHRVIAPDLPGFGDSGKPIRSYDAEFYGEWLVSFLDRMGIEKAHLVGNSMGGRIAIEGGLVAPGRVDRLVLLAPSPAFIKYRHFVKVVRVLRPELALIPTPMPRKLVLRELKRMFSKPQRLPDAWHEAAADEFLRVFQTPRGRIAFFSAARQIYLEEPYGDSGFWDRLRALSIPSLFVWGERDRLVPAKFARHVEKSVPHAESVVLEDCGHVPQYEQPEQTHRLVREFLSA